MLFEKLLKANNQVWHNYVEHEFCNLIANGTLAQEKFDYYLEQDYEYLKVYNKCFAIMENTCLKEVERNYFKNNNVNEAEKSLPLLYNIKINNIKISPQTQAYTNYLYKIMLEGTPLEKLVVLAPCTIGYAKAGENIIKKASIQNNPYYSWIEAYTSELYEDVSLDYIDMLNEYQPTEQEFNKLSKIFAQVCQLEADFFTQATGQKMNKVLTIAGSDSSGGAGIQADLKAISANNCYGASVITAITAQATTGVYNVETVSEALIAKQLQVVVKDIDFKCLKIGMLGTKDVIQTVSTNLPQKIKLVLDPVMVAKDKTKLLDAEAINSLVELLFPKAYIITPNIEEANVILNMNIKDIKDMKNAAKKLHQLGAKNVLVKGGHLSGEELVDVLYYHGKFYEYPSKRIKTLNTHGTGCSLASAIAANLANDLQLDEAVYQAINYVQAGIIENYPIGQGKGPINHFNSHKKI
ncbi:MAG: bifunctional hydroxymethylpyrimidine kinase/phosphomethylpyrimidine kinase [Mycoplasmatales bacterium]